MEDLKTPIPDEGPTEEKPVEDKKLPPKKVVKKAAPAKAAKKAPAKAAKKSEASDGAIKLAQLAKEAGITPQRARQKLRAAEVERDGRWSWEPGSRALAAARKALDLN